jgi:exodeoxyribonuclease V gamma subunit
MEALAPAARQRLEALLAPVRMPAVPTVARLSMSIAQLRKWLECPLQGGAALRLGLRALAEDEAAQVEEEPFESGGLERRQLLRGALWETLRGGDGADICFLHLRERQASQGVIPLGLLGEEESRRHLETLQIWEGLLKGQAPLVHRFGDAPEGELPPTALHPALSLEVPLKEGTITVELSGFIEPQWRGGSLLLSERRGSDPAMESGRFTSREKKEALKAYLDQVFLAASGIQAGPHRAWICAAGSPKQRGLSALDFPALEPGAALELLRTWLSDALGNVHPYAIPIEAVLEDAEDLGEWVHDKLEQDRGFSSKYGPISRPEEHLPPEDMDWKGLVRGRLAGFLGVVMGEKTP